MSNWVFSQKERSEYKDTEGAVYEFSYKLPNARHVSAGDYFVYYRPKKDAADGGGYYFGAGQVRIVETQGLVRRALIKDYHAFPRNVLESGLPECPRNNLQNSINRISHSTLQLIADKGNPTKL
jgi:hypothetical protein